MCFSAEETGEGSLFSENLAGISSLTQCTPCNRMADFQKDKPCPRREREREGGGS